MQTIHEAAARVRQLRMELVAQQETYYQNGISPITDRAYDTLYQELSLLERYFPELQSADSPTQSVGYTSANTTEWVAYPSPMYSLDNTYDVDGILHFIRRLGVKNTYYADAKLDGIASRLLYEAGQLTCVLSRGDKQSGRNITRAAALIRTLPVELPRAMSLDLVGEISADYATYQAINTQRRVNGRRTYASPRHAVIGLLSSQADERETLRELTFTPHKVHADPFSVGSHKRTIEALADMGFKVQTGVIFVGEDIHTLQQFYDRLRSEAEGAEGIAADGLVIRLDDLALSAQMGYTERAPRYAIAYKFPSPIHKACIEEIRYTVGRTGQVSPLALFQKAVPIAGLSIHQASLHSASTVLEKGYAPGAEVSVTLGGSTIPSVTERLSPPRSEITLPSACPSCGHSLTLRGRHLYCDYATCGGVLYARLRYAVSRDALNLRAIGDAAIQYLIQVAQVTSLAECLILLESDAPMQAIPQRSRTACRERLVDLKVSFRKGERDIIRRILQSLSINELSPGLIGRLVAANPRWTLAEHLHALSDFRTLKALGVTARTAALVARDAADRTTEGFALLEYLTTPIALPSDDILPI